MERALPWMLPNSWPLTILSPSAPSTAQQ
jgi:hypothetical protein